MNAIPLLGGFRYYVATEATKLYIGGQAGLHRLITGSDLPQFQDLHIVTYDSRTAFSFGPTFGAEYGRLDFSANYMMMEDANYFGFNLGFALLSF